jgi:hypothetical protein
VRATDPQPLSRGETSLGSDRPAPHLTTSGFQHLVRRPVADAIGAEYRVSMNAGRAVPAAADRARGPTNREQVCTRPAAET